MQQKDQTERMLYFNYIVKDSGWLCCLYIRRPTSFQHLRAAAKSKALELCAISSARGSNCLWCFSPQCFMNSILQCLSNTHSLRDYCLHNSHRRDLNNNSRTNTALMEGERGATQPPRVQNKPFSQLDHTHSLFTSRLDLHLSEQADWFVFVVLERLLECFF